MSFHRISTCLFIFIVIICMLLLGVNGMVFLLKIHSAIILRLNVTLFFILLLMVGYRVGVKGL